MCCKFLILFLFSKKKSRKNLIFFRYKKCNNLSHVAHLINWKLLPFREANGVGERQTRKKVFPILFAINKFSFMIMWKVEISEAIKFKNYQSYIISWYLIASRLIRETKRVVKIHKNKIYCFLILLCLISWFLFQLSYLTRSIVR